MSLIWLSIAAFLADGAIRFVGEPPAGVEVVATAPAATSDAKLSLHRIDPKTGELGTAMFAKTRVSGGEIRLKPSVPLNRGSTYRAVLKIPGKSGIFAEIQVPAQKSPPPRILAIHPTASQLPANLLKFYLHFDQPMREGRDIFDQIHLLDASGKPVHSPWRRQELWNADATRLTLWIHPGRIKRGVNLREQLGPVLKPGQTYALTVDATVRSAAGVALGKEIRRNFVTGPEDYERPLPKTWILTPPQAGAHQPLFVESPEPLDRAMLAAHLWITDPGGERLEVETIAEAGDSAWRMLPKQAWAKGEHRLHVGEFLEDLAGNTRVRVFDTDLTEAEVAPGAAFLSFRPF